VKLFPILITGIFCLLSQVCATVPEITVGVFERQEKIQISAENGFAIYDISSKKVEVFKRWNKSVLDVSVTERGFGFLTHRNLRHIEIVPFRKHPIHVNKMVFRGILRIREDRFGKMTVINVLDVESYLYGVIKSEMLLNSPIEALKAQAVVARTYAIRNQDKFLKDLGFGLTRDVRSQVYNGVLDEHDLAIQVVDATRGRILTHEGQPISAYYHSACGGATQDSGTWGNRIAYLKATDCKYCENYKDLHWEYELSLRDLTNKLREKGHVLSNISDVKLSKDAFGRVIRVELVHADGTMKMNANHLRTLLGPNVLRSTMFNDLSRQSGDTDPAEKAIDQILNSFMSRMNGDRSIRWHGKGFGHGVGLCQWGAKGLANKGYNFENILKYYYSDVSVTRLYD